MNRRKGSKAKSEIEKGGTDQASNGQKDGEKTPGQTSRGNEKKKKNWGREKSVQGRHPNRQGVKLIQQTKN